MRLFNAPVNVCNSGIITGAHALPRLVIMALNDDSLWHTLIYYSAFASHFMYTVTPEGGFNLIICVHVNVQGLMLYHSSHLLI